MGSAEYFRYTGEAARSAVFPLVPVHRDYDSLTG